MKVEKGSDEIIEDKNCCHKQTHRTKEEKKIVNDRLNRIEGQIKGIKKMIDEDRYCNDVLIQLSAVENSIRSLSNHILENNSKCSKKYEWNKECKGRPYDWNCKD